jgi:hypothetical protein
MGQCSATFDEALTDTFVLGINLVGYEAKNHEKRLAQIMEDPKVNAEITRALNKAMLDLAREQAQGKTTTGVDAAKKFGLRMRDNVAPKAADVYKKEVQKSEAFKAAKRSLTDLKCAVKESPIGVWVDENQTMLIIIAAGLALGGGVAMYRARAGDDISHWAAKLAPMLLKFKVIGGVEIGVEEFKFKPSERAIELKSFAEIKKWKAVEARFEAFVSTKNDAVIEFGGNMELTAKHLLGPVDGVLKAELGANRALSDGPLSNDLKANYRLALGIKTPKNQSREFNIELLAYVQEKDEKFKLGTAAKLSYDTKLFGQPVSGYATGEASRLTTPGKGTKDELTFEAGFSVKF